jgi:hypothetical protein
MKSVQEVLTSHPTLPQYPPKVTAPDSGHSISWFAYNYVSHDHAVPTTNELSLHPRSRAMRKHKQKMCQP